MLAPQDTPTRERKSLDGLWRFALDAESVGRTEGWWERPLAGGREIPVPSSYNDVFPEAEVHNHVGDAWYQTTVRVPRGWAGERIVLRFGSATHRAVVWVDGTRGAEGDRDGGDYGDQDNEQRGEDGHLHAEALSYKLRPHKD